MVRNQEVTTGIRWVLLEHNDEVEVVVVVVLVLDLDLVFSDKVVGWMRLIL